MRDVIRAACGADRRALRLARRLRECGRNRYKKHGCQSYAFHRLNHLKKPRSVCSSHLTQKFRSRAEFASAIICAFRFHGKRIVAIDGAAILGGMMGVS
jgi:hypothetical protein